MINKESFLEKLRVLGNQYANNIILNSKNKDAKDIIISDYLQGASDSYVTFRTYDKKRFCDSLRDILHYQEKLDKLEDALGCAIFESYICESVTFIITSLIRALANDDSETMDDIEWWLYEDEEKEWIIDGELIKVETPEQFYDALKKLNRV